MESGYLGNNEITVPVGNQLGGASTCVMVGLGVYYDR